jgi:hypothetical protein
MKKSYITVESVLRIQNALAAIESAALHCDKFRKDEDCAEQAEWYYALLNRAYEDFNDQLETLIATPFKESKAAHLQAKDKLHQVWDEAKKKKASDPAYVHPSEAQALEDADKARLNFENSVRCLNFLQHIQLEWFKEQIEAIQKG